MDETSKMERMPFYGLHSPGQREDLNPKPKRKRIKGVRKHAKSGKNWIKGAIKHPGALRATAKQEGLINGSEKLSSSDLTTLGNSSNPTTRRRAALAKTFKSFS